MLPEGGVEVEAGTEALWLLPGLAAYWPRRKTLLVADAHLGKAAAFRGAGIPVPRGTTEENLDRLSALARTCRAERIVFLGDLVHSAAARRAASAAFIRWRRRENGLHIVLVRGNHDRHAGDPEASWEVECVPEPHVEDTLALCHAPQAVAGCYAIAGHTHPGARLSGRGRERLRLPCFWFTPTHAVLPAFGAFTGLADVLPAARDRVYLAAGARVVRAGS